ncbi:MAG TPA: hypothetical protein VFX59_19890 [Polyangiales bacterium]|nr:hypothetical protein [Polyangiales bacterium]
MKRPDLFAPARPGPSVAFEFVLDALEGLPLSTRAMFGSTAVYVGEQVVFILRKRGDGDDGVWLAFEPGREDEVQRALPNLVRIDALPNVRNWRKLAASHPSFEDDVNQACALVRQGGLLGKTPDRQKAKKARRTAERTPTARKAKPRTPRKTAPRKPR